MTAAPLIVTADLPRDLEAWAEGLRRAHYPSERNRVEAHLTLFHALPPSCEEELRDALAVAARRHPPLPARLQGVMPLGNGTALRVESPAMSDLRRDLAARFQGLLTPQDAHDPRLHITIQNKVPVDKAKALQSVLARTLLPRDFRFAGLALHRYRDRRWELVRRWSFRG